MEPFSHETLGGTFSLTWPDYEILFCVDDSRDPIVPLIMLLIESHPNVDAKLRVGQETAFDNPKLNNMAKGWRCAKHDWIVFLDSNVLPPRDYLQRLFLAFESENCMVSAPPAGSAPIGFWSEVECSLLNALQARFQYAADSLGFGFAQGKTLFFARRTLEDGGFEALGNEPAEDAAATKLMRSQGGRVRLAGPPFLQPLGRKTFHEVFDRHVRWARLRRLTFPQLFLLELLLGVWTPFLAVVVALAPLHFTHSQMSMAGISFVICWYIPEFFLCYFARWSLGWKSPIIFLARDLLLPIIFLNACLGKRVVWKGREVVSRPKLGDRSCPGTLRQLFKPFT